MKKNDLKSLQFLSNIFFVSKLTPNVILENETLNDKWL